VLEKEVSELKMIKEKEFEEKRNKIEKEKDRLKE
jgi:hypothetical protein